MPNPFVKLWRYLTASANAKIDEKADPKIQIQQAIEAEQQRHQALANQAAAHLLFLPGEPILEQAQVGRLGVDRDADRERDGGQQRDQGA